MAFRLRAGIIVVYALMFANCRALSTSKAPVTPLLGGVHAIVVAKPMFLPSAIGEAIPMASANDDLEAAQYVGEDLRSLGHWDLLPTLPASVLPPGKARAQDICTRARAAGARYAVRTSSSVVIEHHVTCWLGNGLLQSVAVPVKIPFTNHAVRVEKAFGLADGCNLSSDDGWEWSKKVVADVVDTSTCTRTGARFVAFKSGDSRTRPHEGLFVLRDEIFARVADLFPKQAAIDSVQGGLATATAPGIRAGEVYQVYRPEEGAMTSLETLGYVRHAGEGMASLEPYAAGEEFQAGDFIVSRGEMKWAELLPRRGRNSAFDRRREICDARWWRAGFVEHAWSDLRHRGRASLFARSRGAGAHQHQGDIQSWRRRRSHETPGARD